MTFEIKEESNDMHPNLNFSLVLSLSTIRIGIHFHVEMHISRREIGKREIGYREISRGKWGTGKSGKTGKNRPFC